ncbi:sulfur oxidation c-type cytochrome SoxA [Polynucleobacter sp. CS-Odin-A6]|uniref:sulfur oxidation c-type cytochrome SoxA n=1 Tax=Polynucleobacter sp. CS-Odin-A6 TaxID=2689106 RepID=UPI00351D570D
MNIAIFCNPWASILLSLLIAPVALAAKNPVEIPKESRQSSYQLMTPENQAMQDDPNLNPAMFWVMDGHSFWQEKAGNQNISCASCHGDSGKKMAGVATQFPKVIQGKLQTLEGQINQCRTSRQEAPALIYESKTLLALSTFVASQSKGMPIAIKETPQNTKDLQQGKQFFNERMGQLNLSCAQCHQERAGLKLGGSLIPQGHPTAYPIYRIEWQTMGSLQRRLRNCMSGVRSKQFEYGSTEMAQLELFLMWRARGIPLESPGVRP